MVATILPNIWRVAFEWTLGGQSAANIMCFQSSATDAATLHASIDSAVTAGMWSAQCSPGRVSRLSYTRLDGVTATSVVTTIGTKWDAGADTDFDPAVAIYVRFNTAFRGPASRGGVKLPFTSSAQTSTGLYSGATSAAVGAAWTAFRNSMSSNGNPLHVVHFLPKEPAVGEAALSHPVTSVSVQSVLSTIRRRQDRIRASV